jgi:hypothetical protein
LGRSGSWKTHKVRFDYVHEGFQDGGGDGGRQTGTLVQKQTNFRLGHVIHELGGRRRLRTVLALGNEESAERVHRWCSLSKRNRKHDQRSAQLKYLVHHHAWVGKKRSTSEEVLDTFSSVRLIVEMTPKTGVSSISSSSSLSGASSRACCTKKNHFMSHN